MTRFPHGLSSWGIPVLPGMPVLFGGTSKAIFCDPANGSDANSGLEPKKAVATLYKAHSLMTANKNDVCYLISNGAASGSARLSLANATSVDSTATTGTLTWSKAACHLIGVAPPSVNPRARIATPTGTYTEATFNALPFITVSASSCLFQNLSTFQQFSTGANGEININITGSYNVFDNVFMGGMASTLAAQGANSRVLKIATGGENLFVNCQIGLDTVLRSALNANIEFASGTARNRFYNCVFPIWTDDVTSLGILGSAAACMDRYQHFENCSFINAIQSTGSTLDALATLPASAGGMLHFKDCSLVGITEYGTDATTRNQTYVMGASGTAATTGIAIIPT